MSNRGPRIAELREQIHRRHREAIQARSVRRAFRRAWTCPTGKRAAPEQADPGQQIIDVDVRHHRRLRCTL